VSVTLDDIYCQVKELAQAQKEQARQLMLLRGKNPEKPEMSTAEVAAMFGMTSRRFRTLYVRTGKLHPIPHHKCVFYRSQAEALLMRERRMGRVAA